MMQEARIAAASRKKTPPPASHSAGHSATGAGAAFQQYQAAVQLLQQGRYERARAAFEKLSPTAPPEIHERCQMYIATCQRQLDEHRLTFPTPEEHYDYAVSQLNTGYYEEAREEFNSILADYPQADYALYGLGVVGEDAVELLARFLVVAGIQLRDGVVVVLFRGRKGEPMFV